MDDQTKDNQLLESNLSNGYRFYRASGRSQGWVAMITLEGVRHTRYFADAKYGSANVARMAAESAGAEDQAIQREWMSIQRRLRVRSTSRSGIAGVSRYSGTYRRGDHWVAYWLRPCDDKRMYRRFYTKVYGEERAQRLAIEARNAGTEPDRHRLEEIANFLRSRDWEIEAIDCPPPKKRGKKLVLFKIQQRPLIK